MTSRISLALALLSAGTTAACIQQNDDPHPVSKALPKAEDVRIKLPDSGSSSSSVVGELAEWYVATRDVTRGLNGGTAAVLVLVHTIVQFPPTSVDGDVYTWGPHHDALDPAEWRLIVHQLADGSYDWQLDGRNRTDGVEFETIVDGNAVEGGTGRFDLDFDVSERVNPRENDGRGQLGAVYDIPNRTLDLAVDSIDDRDGTPTAIHYDYRYAEATDGGGDMVFAIFGDTDDVGPEPEEVTLRSRWQASGAGRADARVRGGDTGGEVTASECWDTRFLRVFYGDSLAQTEGDASACVFADQDLP